MLSSQSIFARISEHNVTGPASIAILRSCVVEDRTKGMDELTEQRKQQIIFPRGNHFPDNKGLKDFFPKLERFNELLQSSRHRRT